LRTKPLKLPYQKRWMSGKMKYLLYSLFLPIQSLQIFIRLLQLDLKQTYSYADYLTWQLI